MKSFKTVSLLLGKKSVVAAKVIIVALGAGAAVTSVVVINNSTKEQKSIVQEPLLEVNKSFDAERASLLLDFNTFFNSPESELKSVQPIAVRKKQPQVEQEPEVALLEEVPRIEIPKEAPVVAPIEKQEAEVSKEKSQFIFNSNDFEYFRTYGLDREATPPKFEHQDEDLVHFITANIKYPERAFNNFEEGLVEVGFTIEKDGKISDIHIINGATESLNNEAMRIVATLPDWEPKKINDENVRSYASIPIRFELY